MIFCYYWIHSWCIFMFYGMLCSKVVIVQCMAFKQQWVNIWSNMTSTTIQTMSAPRKCFLCADTSCTGNLHFVTIGEWMYFIYINAVFLSENIYLPLSFSWNLTENIQICSHCIISLNPCLQLHKTSLWVPHVFWTLQPGVIRLTN